MSDSGEATPIASDTPAIYRQGIFHVFLNTLRADPPALIAAIFILALVFVAVFAPWVAPYDPLSQNITNAFSPPSAQHWFGTDEYGRDVLSRLIYGARPALIVGVFSVVLAMLIGVPIGMMAGLLLGRFDRVVGWAVDILLAFPPLLMALLIVTLLGTSLPMLVLAISISSIPMFIRLARGSTLVIKNFDFVHMARSYGASNVRIISYHVLPNIVGPIIVIGTLSIAGAVREEASLSFLGMGVLPPAASWGNLIRDGINNLFDAPSLSILPGAILTLTVLAFNMLGDTLRDILDPRGITTRTTTKK
jgi:ABC-type dipeptide/oligopeptide/nickel transport system permease subunit